MFYIDIQSFVYEKETEGIYKGISKNVETKFDTSRCSQDNNGSLLIGKNKTIICMMKYELGGKYP